MTRIARTIVIVVAMVATLAVARNAANSKTLIIAHRGASADAPENTVAAANLAWKQGADGIEGDFYLSADGRVVAIHDSNVKRTAGINRHVSKMTLAELQRLDVGRWKHERFAGERIPTLTQWLDTVNHAPADGLFLLEVKSGPETIGPIKKALTAHPIDKRRIRIIAFKDTVVAESKRQMPDIDAYLLTSFRKNKDTGAWHPTADELIERLKKCSADGADVNANENVIDAPFVNTVWTAGYELHCWTVNDPAVADRFRKLGFDSITTDRPALLRTRKTTAPVGDG